VRRITAVAVASAAVLFAACEGNGSAPTDTTGPQCELYQQATNANNWSNCLAFVGGGGGSGGNTPGLAPAALYRLVLVNGKPLPYTYGPTGTEDSVVTTDSTRIIDFVLDSSYISLNTDSSAMEIDYISFHDVRTAPTQPPGNFNLPPTLVADTSTGTWSDSTGQPTILLLTGKVSNLGYQYSGDTLTGNYAYNESDIEGTNVPGTAVFKYQNIGKSFSNVVVHHGSGFHSASPIRETRTNSPSLSLVGSDYRRGRLVRVVR